MKHKIKSHFPSSSNFINLRSLHDQTKQQQQKLIINFFIVTSSLSPRYFHHHLFIIMRRPNDQTTKHPTNTHTHKKAVHIFNKYLTKNVYGIKSCVPFSPVTPYSTCFENNVYFDIKKNFSHPQTSHFFPHCFCFSWCFVFANLYIFLTSPC